MRIVAVVQQKGGVGKTTIAVNLAAVTAEHSRVLVVDADHVQHSATDWAEASEAEGATAWPFDFTDDARPEVLSQLRAASDYDTIIVHTPGSLAPSEIQRTGLVLDSADFVIVPMEPQPLSVTPLMRTIKSVIEPRGLEYRVLLSRVGREEAQQKRRDETIARLDEMGIPRLRTVIRQYVVHSDAPATGGVVTTYPESRQTVHAISDFSSLALELTSIWANGRNK